MNRLLLITLISILGCTTTPTAPTGAPVESTSPAMPMGSAIEKLEKLVTASSCAQVKFKDRGRMPLGFAKGVALAYQRSLCRYRSTATTVAGVIGGPLGDIEHDTLTHYGLGKDLNGEERLTLTYALLFSLGARESSGKWCEGRDMSASNTSAETAEQGPFQQSANSLTASPLLRPLWREYAANPAQCALAVWKEGVDASVRSCNGTVYGTGEGADWQKFVRTCPAFAAEHAAVLLRTLRRHFGPETRKEISVVPECYELLGEISKQVNCQ